MEDRRSLSLLLLLTGGSGFLLGSFQHGTWQLAIESSQVVAGLIPYSADNPFYLYHSKAWTLLHQVPAILLRLGFSERSLSFLFSGLLGMLSFQTLSLCAWILCRNFLLSFASPFFALFTHAHGHFVIYPVWLFGTSNTQGAFSTFFIILAVLLLAVQRYRIALLLLGIAPAVHLSLGLMCCCIAVTCFVWSPPDVRAAVKEKSKFLWIGIAITVMSILFHFLFTYHSDQHTIAPDATRYLYIFIQNWDSHRVPVPYWRTGFMLNIAVIGIGLLWTIQFPKLLDEKTIFTLRACIAAGLLGLLFSVMSWLPVKMVPATLIIMMPARILEWNVVIFPALILGLLGRHKAFLAALALCALLVVMIITQNMSLPVILTVVFTLVVLPWMLHSNVPESAAAERPSRLYVLRWVSFMILAFMIFECIFYPDRIRPDPNEYKNFNLTDRSDDQIWSQISSGSGLLLTGDAIHLIQLRTRRPVLLDGGQLDLLPYTLEGAAAIDRILTNVYGIDLKNPPKESIRTATIRGNQNREHWESRTAAEWLKVHEQFGVSQVLTDRDWKLSLPILYQSQNLTLFSMPK